MNMDQFSINYLSNKKPSELFERIIKEALEGEETKEDEVKICTLFIEEDYEEDKVKFSLALINGTKSKINFEALDLTFISNENEESVVITQDLRFLNVLPSMTITPFEIVVDKSNFEGIESEITDLKVAFNKKITAHKSVIITDFEAEESISFEDKVKAKMYLKNMELLKEDTLQVKAFKPYVNEEKVNVPIMVINGYNKAVAINGLPIEIKDNNGLAISKKKLSKAVEVKGKFAALILMEFSKSELLKPIKAFNDSIAVISQ